MKKLSLILLMFNFFFGFAQSGGCVKSVIRKALLEDSLALKINDFDGALKALSGQWKFVHLLDDKGRRLEKITEKMPMPKNEFMWMSGNYSFDHTLEIKNQKLKKRMTFFKGSNIEQVENSQLIYLPNSKSIKNITLEGEEICTQIPSNLKIQYLDDKKLVLYHIPFNNKEKVEYLLYIYEKL